MPDEQITRRYVYQSEHTSEINKGKRSAYIVEQLTGSNVVARIKPLGLVKDLTADQEITLLLLKQGISVVGKWSKTTKGNHRRSRAVVGTDFEVE